jgi:glutamyl-tRNA reductase
LDSFKVIAFTHQNLPLQLIGKLHLDNDMQATTLGALKLNFGFEELLFLNTCNRVELFMSGEKEIDAALIKELVLFINSTLNNAELDELTAKAEIYENDEAVKHVFSVAASLESLVVGEREIITQVRKAYDYCNLLGLTGDYIRLLIKQTIETAKNIYTNTDIARNPVSVVSLAYRQLRELGIKNDARIIFIGSGETNTAMAGYLQKHKFANFLVFNRTIENARKLAKTLNGNAYGLSELGNYEAGFDVMVVCTSHSDAIVDKKMFTKLSAGEVSKKVIIDLALPQNVSQEVAELENISYININSLKARADVNLQLRKNEMLKCEEIIQTKIEQFKWLCRERKIEIAFGAIPKEVRAIKDMAMQEIFVKEVNLLDSASKEVLDKVLAYVEKKYNAIAIKTAKEVMMGRV